MKLHKGCIFVILSLLLISGLHAQENLTVTDIFESGKFSGKSLSNFQWRPDSQQFSYTEGLSIWIYDMESRERTKLLDTTDVPVFRQLKRVRRMIPKNHLWSPAGDALLFNSGQDLYLFSIESRTLRRLTDDAEPELHPAFSPDGGKIAYIKRRDLHVLDVASGAETQLTREGAELIRIGSADWVYEEEFGLRAGFHWSPNSSHIAYYKMDESNTPEFPLVDYIPRHNEVEVIRYPKAGDPNAVVNIGVVPAAGGKTVWMDIGGEIDIYIPRIKWHPDNKSLWIYRMNRRQNELDLLKADIVSGKSDIILKELNDNGWLNVKDDLTFLEKRKRFIWSSERSGWNHLYLYQLDGTLERRLTSGEWDVTGLIDVDRNEKHVYFTATEKNRFERHLYSVDVKGKKLRRITAEAGTHRIVMHPDADRYLDHFSNTMTPERISLHSIDGEMKAMIEPNEIAALKDYELSIPEIVTFETDEGVPLNASILKPMDFDPGKKYPVLFHVYGGPGSQSVRNSWGRTTFLWSQMLAQKGYIVFRLDNRGTGYQGRAYRELAYRRLGQLEVEDMVNGVTYLSRMPWVDTDRIGIWGWSYGGYTTIMCMLNAADYFKVGMAVAPVTDWRNYDSIYTERYMDTPANNPDGYEKGSALNIAHKLKGKLLLVHGINDDNVHMSNTIQLAARFQELNIPFDMMVYPRQDHSIRKRRAHLFGKMTAYLLENL
ncbi:MAG: S9 family peptidase [candidate division KSB1 bacterium]|jgi:dipeptidyl-peptidase-4|nr:S9 family peptidase [candidate division KSB1 bacterium]